MAARYRDRITLVLVALAAMGCGRSATSRFYTLASTATPDESPLASYAVIVGPVTVPGVGRPAGVRRAGRAEPRRRSTSSTAGPRR